LEGHDPVEIFVGGEVLDLLCLPKQVSLCKFFLFNLNHSMLNH